MAKKVSNADHSVVRVQKECTKCGKGSKGHCKLDGTETQTNLARAFAGEAQANNRYLMLAERAEADGMYALSEQIYGIAYEENAHAEVFFKLITDNCTCKIDNLEICAGYPYKCGSLVDMLQYAAEIEESESNNIYPEFARVAAEEGFPEIASKFEMIAKIENCHKMKWLQLHEKLSTGSTYKAEQPMKWKCTHCGHETTAEQPWKVCPVCGHPQGFVQIPMQSGNQGA